jgi:hypothetical protein
MPLHGEVFAGPLPKPQRGSWKLEREQRKSGNDAEELAAKKAAKARDGRCRWPLRHKCRGGLKGQEPVRSQHPGEHHHALCVGASERPGIHPQQRLRGATADESRYQRSMRVLSAGVE